MGIFSNIFSGDTANNAVDAVINTGDALFYTDEEKAKAAQLAVDTKLKMLPLFEPFKITQRYLAIVFSLNFLLAFWVGILVYLYLPKLLDGYLDIVVAFQIGWIMLAIVSFYFGGGFIESIKRIKESK